MERTGRMSTQRLRGGECRPSLYHDNWMTHQFYESDSTKWFQPPRCTKNNTSKNPCWERFPFFLMSFFSVFAFRLPADAVSVWQWMRREYEVARHSITCSLCFSLQPLPPGARASHALWLQGYCIGLHYANARCCCCCCYWSLSVCVYKQIALSNRIQKQWTEHFKSYYIQYISYI